MYQIEVNIDFGGIAGVYTYLHVSSKLHFEGQKTKMLDINIITPNLTVICGFTYNLSLLYITTVIK